MMQCACSSLCLGQWPGEDPPPETMVVEVEQISSEKFLKDKYISDMMQTTHLMRLDNF